MSEEKFYDYLVLGGEHHGMIFNGPLVRQLSINKKMQRMAKFYARDEPAETIEPDQVTYKVVEHTRPDGKHFFIASNELPVDTDIESEIRKYEPMPIN